MLYPSSYSGRPAPIGPLVVTTTRISSSASDNSEEKTPTSSSSSTTKRRQKRRRKRKQQVGGGGGGDNSQVKQQHQKQEEKVVVELEPREDRAVNLEVRDVRDLVSGRSSRSAAAASSQQSSSTAVAASASTTTTTAGAGPASTTTDDSLERLLADAKEMKALEERKAKDNADDSLSGNDDEEVFSIPQTTLKILSTLVTVDFFVVCLLLVWFLAGVFCSYVLKNDDVQIAFNGIFQPVVQPALGVLMIGSLLSAVFKEEEESDDQGLGF